jgi:uncharacterized membrane protein YwzB
MQAALISVVISVLCCAVFCCCLLQGPQIVDLLKKNPVVAIPVLITRLEQKVQEWLKVGGPCEV